MEEREPLRLTFELPAQALHQAARGVAGEPLGGALLCNAQVVGGACLRQGAPVFDDGAAVLTRLTAGEMETLLRRLAGEGTSPVPAAVNRDFDQGRFQALKEG